MDDLQTHGASLYPPAGLLANEAAGDLPLIVWLRGDEPYFHEFSLSADDVMAMLGIKRSRLTQIAGRELRVGRTRVDRYIRPVFRACDIEDYLNWTRPTASHKKSSALLEQAADKLASESKELAHQLKEHYDDWRDDLEGSLGQIHKKSEERTRALLFRHKEQLVAKMQLTAAGHELTSRALRQEIADLKRQSLQVQEQTEALAVLPDLMGRLQYLDKAVANLQKEHLHASARTEQLLQALYDKVEELTEEPPQPEASASPRYYRRKHHSPLRQPLPMQVSAVSASSPSRRSVRRRQRHTS